MIEALAVVSFDYNASYAIPVAKLSTFLAILAAAKRVETEYVADVYIWTEQPTRNVTATLINYDPQPKPTE